jgi:hypothetical protein
VNLYYTIDPTSTGVSILQNYKWLKPVALQSKKRERERERERKEKLTAAHIYVITF